MRIQSAFLVSVLALSFGASSAFSGVCGKYKGEDLHYCNCAYGFVQNSPTLSAQPPYFYVQGPIGEGCMKSPNAGEARVECKQACTQKLTQVTAIPTEITLTTCQITGPYYGQGPGSAIGVGAQISDVTGPDAWANNWGNWFQTGHGVYYQCPTGSGPTVSTVPISGRF